MAISPDESSSEQIIDTSFHPEGRSGATSPTPRLPGYIPGMTRPMTPRDISFDSDMTSRSDSTTPRATSPLTPTFGEQSVHLISPLASPKGRRDVNGSPAQRSRPTSPTTPFLGRSTNGRHTPDGGRPGGTPGDDKVYLPSSINRVRPASPLSGPAFQPLAVSSRPGTPSNVTWTMSSNDLSSQRSPGHSRDGSWASDNGDSKAQVATPERASPPARDYSSLLSSIAAVDNDANDLNGHAEPVELQPPPRSATPTQGTRSPVSPSFPSYATYANGNNSRRSSRQNGVISPSFFGSSNPLMFSPMANSSRSSLDSAGSSYHSWDVDKERGLTLADSVDSHTPAWHDVYSGAGTLGGSPDDTWDCEETIARFAGLTKADFVAIQEKLVGAAIAKTITPDPRERVPSLRRRRPSTSQSNYSINGRDTRVCSFRDFTSHYLLVDTGIEPASSSV